MTQEEKAKAYDEAIKKAKEIKEKIVYSHLSTESCKAVSEYIDTIIPELCEKPLTPFQQCLNFVLRKVHFASIPGKMENTDKFILDTVKKHTDELIELAKKQKPAECIEDSAKFEEGFKTGRESGLRDGQKYVLDNAESYGLCKPAEWSEEDTLMLTAIIQTLERFGGRGTTGMQIDWLKSLRPQPKRDCKDCAMFLNGKCTKPHWKPSDVQMDALKEDIDFSPETYKLRCTLVSLYNDLKKLKED